MITTTARALIVSALRQIGVVDQFGDPTANELSDAFDRLNEMIDGWSVQALTFRVVQREVFTLVSGQQVYTVGLTGNFNVARPTTISNVTLNLTSTTPETETWLTPLTEDAYQAVSQKDLENSLPTSYYLEPTIPFYNVWIWPIPDASANELVIYYPEILSQFATLTGSVQLAPSYMRALRTNLAVELAPEFGRQVPDALLLQAGESLGQLKRSNASMMDLALDPGLTGDGHGTYNILTDQG